MMRLGIRATLVLLGAMLVVAHAQTPALTITTEPNAAVWIDGIRRGATDASGKLALTKILPGRHTVRVRANGCKETSVPLPAGRRTLAIKLLPTSDQAELLFQQAETAREQARDQAERQK